MLWTRSGISVTVVRNGHGRMWTGFHRTLPNDAGIIVLRKHCVHSEHLDSGINWGKQGECVCLRAQNSLVRAYSYHLVSSFKRSGPGSLFGKIFICAPLLSLSSAHWTKTMCCIEEMSRANGSHVT